MTFFLAYPPRDDHPPDAVVLYRRGSSALLWDPETDEVWWA